MSISRTFLCALIALLALVALPACGTRPPDIRGAPAEGPGAIAAAPPTPTPAPTATEAAPTPAPAATEAPALAGPTPTPPLGGPRHLVAALDGELLLRKAAWSAPVPVSFGTALAAGDEITLSTGSATLLCSDLSAAAVPAGVALMVETDICPPGGPARINLPEGRITAMRGRNPDVPYVISPRFTGLRDGQPTITWNDTGNPPYSLMVTDGLTEWYREGLAEPRVVYDGVPPLVTGAFYTVVITDSQGRHSEEEAVRGRGFWLLAPPETGAVAADEAQLTAAGLPAEGAAYARAWLLTGYGLRSEAAAGLRALLDSGQGGAAAAVALGDLYRELALTLLAEEAYTGAVTLAAASGDEPMLAAAEAGLGDVLAQLNETERALTALASARERFLALGDAGRAEELADLIAVIRTE